MAVGLGAPVRFSFGQLALIFSFSGFWSLSALVIYEYFMSDDIWGPLGVGFRFDIGCWIMMN